jgi:hypothetical protein
MSSPALGTSARCGSFYHAYVEFRRYSGVTLDNSRAGSIADISAILGPVVSSPIGRTDRAASPTYNGRPNSSSNPSAKSSAKSGGRRGLLGISLLDKSVSC